MGRLFDELKRRNVIRVAIAYIVAAWLMLQVLDLVLENIGAPDWVMQLLMALLALGLPFAVLFAWAYELTPEGIKRERDVDRSQSITPETGRKLDIATIGMLVAVLVVVGIDRFVLPKQAPAPQAAETVVDENSIAVLAFEDLSPEGDQAYFAEGLSEELLNSLAKVDDLKVAGRTSSFAFKGQDTDLREIGQLLNVAHILEGSVRKAGNRIRVTAQLIKASDGFHLFSETYERNLDDVFAVQDELAEKISAALLQEMGSAGHIDTAETTSPEVYELYLLARQRLHTRDLLAMREADRMLDRAIELDPGYAPALAQKALSLALLSDAPGAYGDRPQAEILPSAQALLDNALALDSDLAEAYAVRGLLYYNQRRFEDGVEVLEQALELNPTMSDAQNWLANNLVSLNRRSEAREQYEEIFERDPLYGPAFANLVLSYARSRAFDKAEPLIGRVEQIIGTNDEISLARAIVDMMRGQHASAVRNIQVAYVDNPSSTVMRSWYGIALTCLGDWEGVLEVGDPGQQFLARGMLAAPGGLDDIIAEVDVFGGFPHRTLRFVGTLYSFAGRYADYVAYIDDEFGSLDALLQRLPPEEGWFPEYAGDLAYAYLQTGDEDSYRILLAEIERSMEIQRDEQTENWASAIGQTQFAALRGDLEQLIEAMRYARSLDLVRVETFSLPMYDFARDDSRFRAIEEEILADVDAQRAELGLPPYRPVDAVEESRPSVVY